MAPIGMSEEEQEQRQIYKKILEYEQEAVRVLLLVYLFVCLFMIFVIDIFLICLFVYSW